MAIQDLKRFATFYRRILDTQRALPPRTQDASVNIERRLMPIIDAAQGRRDEKIQKRGQQ